jgi:hypothetical protein
VPSANTICPICGFVGAAVKTGSVVVCEDVVKAFDTLTSSLLIQLRKSATVVADVDEGKKLIVLLPLERLCQDP